MGMPSSLIDRSATGVVANVSDARLDQAKYLHHAGSPRFLALTALGVVYGDIGTSPLYAFSGSAENSGFPRIFRSSKMADQGSTITSRSVEA